MRRRPTRYRVLHLAAVVAVLATTATATVSWALTGGTEQLGLPLGAADPGGPATWPATGPGRALHGVPQAPAVRPATSTPVEPGVPAQLGRAPATCTVGAKLVPTCNVLWGVAPGAFTDARGRKALADFERSTGRHQDVFHAYHSGETQLFPTENEIAIARQKGKERLLLLNWKPTGASWAQIARGDRRTDRFIDRLAVHLKQNFREPFFLAIHHEAENEVRERRGSGYEAEDYAAMFRHVVTRLRARGATNVVFVLIHMAYVPHTSQDWFEKMYPGDRYVDWIGFDTYAYSDPGYGHGDFREMLNRRQLSRPNWPGFYNWARAKHPGKPLMVAEWGVWASRRNPGHMAEFFREVGQQIGQFPQIKALIHFDTPHNQKGRSSRVDTTAAALNSYRWLGRQPIFKVDVRPSLM